jgi:hypothetical protein
MSKDIDDFLFGGGGAAAKFESQGDMVKGTVIEADLKQQTSMEDNKPLFWDNGDPRMQLVIRLQTDERDPSKEDDDGVRTIYAKGGNFEVAEGQGKSLKDAIADALKQAGIKALDNRVELKVAFTGLGKKTNRGYSAPKLFTAKATAVEPPKAAVSTADLFDD